MKRLLAQRLRLWACSTAIAVTAALSAWSTIGAQEPPSQASGDHAPNGLCLLCHAQPGLTTKVDGQERTIAAVDQAAFTSSAHAGQTCVSCHADESALPHPLASRATPTDGVTACAACHLDAYEGYLESPHGTMADLRDGSGPTCADCHGSAHAVRPIRAWSDEQRAQICAGCHTGAGTDFLGALSHEAPSPRHLQLVYFAGRFLTILAAASLAFGIIHVELDLLRWLVRRWRSRPARREPWEST